MRAWNQIWRSSMLSWLGIFVALIVWGNVAGVRSPGGAGFDVFTAAHAASESPAPRVTSAVAVVSSEAITPAPQWGELHATHAHNRPVATAKRPVARSKLPVVSLARAPIPAMPMLDMAWQAYQAGRNDEARERYEQVIDGGNNVDVQLGLAAIAVRQNRYENAMQYYQRALSLAPHNVTALAALATLQEGGRHAVDTEMQIKQVLDQQPSAALQFSLGNLYAAQQHWREAEAAYFGGFQADQLNADYAYNLAVSLDHLRQYPSAVTYYLKARDLLVAGSGDDIDRGRLNARIQQLQDAAGQAR